MSRIPFIASSLMAAALALQGCAGTTPHAQVAGDCSRLGADIAQTGEQRREAIEQGESAWKAVVPFAVLARKAKAKSVVEAADARLVELQAASERQGCSRNAG